MAVLRFVPQSEISSRGNLKYFASFSSSENWFEIIAIGTVLFVPMAIMLLAALTHRCLETWRWLKMVITRSSPDVSAPLENRSAMVMSHSLPDLQSCLKKEQVETTEPKKVIRHSTLPIASGRNRNFQKQINQPSIQFSICRLEDKAKFDLGLIQPELYQREEEGAGSGDSSPSIELQYAGKLHFALRYDPDIEGLMVKVLEARDIPARDASLQTDPYVKVHLLPDKEKKFRTKVRRKSLNPVFNETFIFSVDYEDLQNRYLQFSVYDFDGFNRHDLIGHVVLTGLLSTTDLHKEVEYTMNILCPPEDKEGLGEIMLSLCYLPTAERLTLTIIKAKNLKAMDVNGKSDPFVKLYLLCNGKRLKKKKTTVKKSTLSPVFNEAFVFDVPSVNVDDVCLVLKVLDYDRIGSNEFLGCIAIGSSSNGIGRNHWLEMLENPRKPVAQWYPLLDALPGNVDLSLKSSTISLSCLSSG